MPPERTEETESLDRLGEGLPENVREEVRQLLIEAARIQNEVLDDGNRGAGMQEVFARLHMLVEGLNDEVQRGLADRAREEAEAEKYRLLAEGFELLQGKRGRMHSAMIDRGEGLVRLELKRIFSLAEEGKVRLELMGDEHRLSGAVTVETLDEVEVMVQVDPETKTVCFIVNPGDLPDSPQARLLIAKEFKAVGTSKDERKYKRLKKFDPNQLFAQRDAGNITILSKPFGEENARADEVLRLCTAGEGVSFTCLITEAETEAGADAKIETYLTPGGRN